MAALIEITSPLSSSRALTIQSAVTVIGGGADADVPIADVDDRVATIEFRDGKYLVHNRSPRRMRLCGRVLRPQAVRAWSSGDVLRIDDAHELVLWAEADPRPGPPQLLPPPPGCRFLNAPQRRTRGRPSGLAIAGLLVLAAMAVWTLRIGRSRPAEITEFEAVIQLWRSPSFEDQTLGVTSLERIVIRRLQEARGLELAGNRGDMYASYARLKNFLLSRAERDVRAADARIDPTLRFVCQRLTARGFLEP